MIDICPKGQYRIEAGFCDIGVSQMLSALDSERLALNQRSIDSLTTRRYVNQNVYLAGTAKPHLQKAMACHGGFRKLHRSV